jgi:hypothetical protein
VKEAPRAPSRLKDSEKEIPSKEQHSELVQAIEASVAASIWASGDRQLFPFTQKKWRENHDASCGGPKAT